LFAFFALLFLGCGLEQSVGAWEPTYLHASGMTLAGAAAATSLFWAAYTVGRLAGAPLFGRVTSAGITFGALSLATAFLLGAMAPGFKVVAFAGVGLSLALVVPALIAWLRLALPTSDGVATLVLSGGNFGIMVLPVVAGLVIAGFGSVAMPIACASMAVIAMVGAWLLSRTENATTTTALNPTLASGAA
jgi:fucose permease